MTFETYIIPNGFTTNNPVYFKEFIFIMTYSRPPEAILGYGRSYGRYYGRT